MEELLIEHVRENEFLYNIRSSHYRDQQMKHETWQEIGKELNMTADAVKKKWDVLRRCFLNALSRRAKNGDSTTNVHPWKFEAQMSFLLPYLDHRRIKHNTTDNHWTDNADVQLEADTNKDAPSKTSPCNRKMSSCVQESKKIKWTGTDNTIKEAVNALKENAILKRRTFDAKRTANMDETDMFFLSMSRMTKTLPQIEQTKIKKLLSNAVLDAQLRMSEEQQPHPSSCSILCCEPISTSTTHPAFTPQPSDHNYMQEEAKQT